MVVEGMIVGRDDRRRSWWRRRITTDKVLVGAIERLLSGGP